MDKVIFKKQFAAMSKNPRDLLVGLRRNDAINLFRSTGKQELLNLALGWPLDRPFYLTKKTHEDLTKMAEQKMAKGYI